MIRRDDVRNIAIIAHVDHGKTTLIDGLLKTCRVFRENQKIEERILDSNDQERERGITIFAKNIALQYKGVKFNVVDTPGHADFGGEVERVLSMVDGCLLLVDAFEGPMPQTRFVLQKAFQHGLKVMVVVNKIDRPDARPHDVLDEIFDLFCDLEANDDQLDFHTIYGSARERFIMRTPDGERLGMEVLLDAIIEKLPGPTVDPDAPFRFQVSKIDYDNFLGRIAIGRVHAGTVTKQSPFVIVKPGKAPRKGEMKALQAFHNMNRVDVEKAIAGDIIAVVGVPEIEIGETMTDPTTPNPLPVVAIDEPTVSLVFSVNDGPFAGQAGQYVTSRHIRDRLVRESLSNVALRLEDGPTAESMKVSGRGVMHLGVVIESMRREGYEFCVSRPEVIIKTIDGKPHEPIERLLVNVPDSHAGKVIEAVGQRRGEMLDMRSRGSLQTLTFLIPARGLIGLRTRLLSSTNGEAVMYHIFNGWERYKGEIPTRSRGVMIATETDTAVTYAMNNLKDRGTLFVDPGSPVYEGQVVGEHCRPDDIGVNISRRKQLTNMRAAGSDENIILPPARKFNVEEALEYIGDDELVEFTPEAIRMRKRFLRESDRRKQARKATNSVKV